MSRAFVKGDSSTSPATSCAAATWDAAADGRRPGCEVPPRKLRPVSQHELDPLAVRRTDLSRVGDGPSRRGECDALLEYPGEEHQHRVAEEQAEQDADEKHGNKT